MREYCDIFVYYIGFPTKNETLKTTLNLSLAFCHIDYGLQERGGDCFGSIV